MQGSTGEMEEAGKHCVVRGDKSRFSISKWRRRRHVSAVNKCTGTVSKCKCNADTRGIGYNLVLMEYRYESGKRFLRRFWKRIPVGVVGARTVVYSDIMLDLPVEGIFSFT